MKLKTKYIAYISLIIYWSPSNVITYLWGPLLFIFAIIGYFIRGKSLNRYSFNLILLVFIFILLFFFSFVVNSFREFTPNNLLWTLITYGSTFSLIPAFLLFSFKKEDLSSILKFGIWLAVFQTFLGYFFMISHFNFVSFNPFNLHITAGDFFVGTLFKYGYAHITGIKISIYFFLLLPFWLKKKSLKNTILMVVLLIGWILSSTLYSLIIGGTVLVMFFLLPVFKKMLLLKFSTKTVIIACVFIFGSISMLVIQPDNVRYIKNSLKIVYNTVMSNDTSNSLESQKILYFKDTYFTLTNDMPEMLFLGVGPGNYSSRSAWMVSGLYLNNQPNYILITPSEIAKKYTIPYYMKIVNKKHNGAGSITHQPFSSITSIFAELGILGLTVFILILKLLFKDPLKNILSLESSHGTGIALIFVYLIGLSIVDNTFEFPRITGEILIFVVVFGSLKNQE